LPPPRRSLRAVRVLFCIDSLAGGGTERSLAELLPLLRERGVEPVVACLKRAGGEIEAAVSAAFGVRFLHARGRARRALELRAVLAEERPEVLHTLLFEADVLGRLAAAGGPAAVLTSLVNATYDPSRLADPRISRVKLEAARRVDGWTARHLTDRFHAVSDDVARAAVAALGIPAARITVIERGRDRTRLGEPGPERRRAARAALGLSDGDEVVVSIGRQEFQKGQRHLVEAVRLLGERQRLVLLVAGRAGQASAELNGLAGERTRLLGHRDDVPELLAAADVFALPSLYEGQSGALIEAMALGLPVVASDIAAVRSMVEPERNALLVPPGHAGALAQAIAALLDDPGRREAFGVRGRELFEERYGLERSADRFAELYERVRAARRSPGSRA
jgi:glycosyltransferase involved in cell wall biosynthesis